MASDSFWGTLGVFVTVNGTNDSPWGSKSVTLSAVLPPVGPADSEWAALAVNMSGPTGPGAGNSAWGFLSVLLGTPSPSAWGALNVTLLTDTADTGLRFWDGTTWIRVGVRTWGTTDWA